MRTGSPFLRGAALCFEPVVFRKTIEGGSSYWAVYFGISALIVGGILSGLNTSKRGF